MHAEEGRLGCKMTDREREGFARGFHAPSMGQSLGGWQLWPWSRSTSTEIARRETEGAPVQSATKSRCSPYPPRGPFSLGVLRAVGHGGVFERRVI
jgi:hypothetical protein